MAILDVSSAGAPLNVVGGISLQMVMYHAVIKTKESNVGVAPYSVWGEATPYAIAALCAAARSSRRENMGSVDLEVALSGEGKDVIVHELERMGRQLATQGVRLHVL